MLRFLVILITVSFLFGSCKKETYELVEITDNQAPPDNTIESIVTENYINRVYISVLGRKPDASELNSGYFLLGKNGLSITDRNSFLDEVFAKTGYNQRLYEIASIKLLTRFDTSAISQQLYIYQFLLTDSTYAPVFPQIYIEIARLEKLKNIPQDLVAGTLNTIGMHRRLINNVFYDEINMGTENFVVSTYQHFMDRYPTINELEQGKNMVDGLSAVLFFQQGKTKDNYMDIILATDNYFESQVRELYLRFLFREPTSEEMATLAASYKLDSDYKKLQKSILSTDEYVGIK